MIYCTNILSVSLTYSLAHSSTSDTLRAAGAEAEGEKKRLLYPKTDVASYIVCTAA